MHVPAAAIVLMSLSILAPTLIFTLDNMARWLIERLPTISPSLHPGNIAINPITVNPSRRNFDEAVIDACQQLGSQHAERQKTLHIVDVLDLKPFAFFDKNGIEQNTLAHERVISNITADNDSIIPIFPLCLGCKG
ncbi:hypothetical protein BD408DRAFT_405851 [Parasitella parasitica]|nr:hypothetical protein BD408DRAFT_405851 [Parasitella parasitica]